MEWLVVDDGSDDGTADLVRRWAVDAPFPVRLIVQPNSGKHVALNRAMRQAHGEFVALLDSDDTLLPDALQTLYGRWLEIPAERRGGFVGVTGLCIDDNGDVVGGRFPVDPLDIPYQECVYRYRMTAERWGIQRTELLREVPFPEPTERTYVPESLVWRRIGRNYRTRYVNDVVRRYRQQPSSTTDQITALPARTRAAGAVLHHCAVLNEDLAWLRGAFLPIVKSGAHLARFGFHTGLSLRAQASLLRSPAAKAIWLCGLPVGRAAFVHDRRAATTARAARR